jgi:hypothetical protein
MLANYICRVEIGSGKRSDGITISMSSRLIIANIISARVWLENVGREDKPSSSSPRDLSVVE